MLMMLDRVFKPGGERPCSNNDIIDGAVSYEQDSGASIVATTL